jgi:hypothetical protein
MAPPYLIGLEVTAGHLVLIRPAESLLWGQVLLIQIAATMADRGGTGVVVRVQSKDGAIRDRVVVRPEGGQQP